MASIGISIFFISLLMIGIVALLFQQLLSFMHEWPVLRIKVMEALNDISRYLLETFNFTRDQQNQLLKQSFDNLGVDLVSILSAAIASSSASLVLVVLTPVFSALILYYRRRLVKVLYLIFPLENRVGIRNILMATIQAYYNFIKGMGMVYLIVGTLNSIGLLLIGVPYAFFFGYTVAVLTFIPYVGIVIGALLPISMAWITYNSVWYPVGVVLLFTFVQYLEANIIFPLAVSNRLQINALATLCSILLGGILWGVAGMILFVPFLAIIKLITDHSPRFKTWSTLLGTGNLS